jgi:hypothetical protein
LHSVSSAERRSCGVSGNDSSSDRKVAAISADEVTSDFELIAQNETESVVSADCN